mmetsp:Transcript_3197/g.7489  ORF Transcript_3197/g.7489 Transcript_3197/m.7489 type:complete len:187 (-) Transcript_3197:146-706(-)
MTMKVMNLPAYHTAIFNHQLPTIREDESLRISSSSMMGLSSEMMMEVDDAGSCSPSCRRPLQMHHYNDRPENIAKTFGSGNLDTAQTYQNIASLLVDVGKYDEALDVCEDILEILLRILGKDHLATAANYHNMGEILEMVGKLDEAMGMYEVALQIRLKILGEKDSDTVATHKILHNLQQKMTQSQ